MCLGDGCRLVAPSSQRTRNGSHDGGGTPCDRGRLEPARCIYPSRPQSARRQEEPGAAHGGGRNVREWAGLHRPQSSVRRCCFRTAASHRESCRCRCLHARRDVERDVLPASQPAPMEVPSPCLRRAMPSRPMESQPMTEAGVGRVVPLHGTRVVSCHSADRQATFGGRARTRCPPSGSCHPRSSPNRRLGDGGRWRRRRVAKT